MPKGSTQSNKGPFHFHYLRKQGARSGQNREGQLISTVR